MNHDTPKWSFQRPKDFERQVLNLPQSIRSKLSQVMIQLSTSYNPNQLGNKKKTKYGVYYTIRLSDDCRIAYAASQATRRTEIYRVSEHKNI
jgi:mRNA-degrading endonuclease RelE of RelBE toxin-antitoxin system